MNRRASRAYQLTIPSRRRQRPHSDTSIPELLTFDADFEAIEGLRVEILRRADD